MGNGNEHRDTGRQRSEPEEGKHARQPEGPTGEGASRGARSATGGSFSNYGGQARGGGRPSQEGVIYYSVTPSSTLEDGRR